MAHEYKWDVNDDHCRSYITDDLRDGCRKFQLVVWTYVYFHPEGQVKTGKHLWSVEAWNDLQKKDFKDSFKRSIESGFGNGAVWLVHGTKGVRDLWCDVEILHTDNEAHAHLKVIALMNPIFEHPLRRGAKAFGAHCEPLKNGWDMVIHNDAVVDPASLPYAYQVKGEAEDGTLIRQQTAQHEFGHYLRIGHTCASDAPNATGEEYNKQYCTVRDAGWRRDLMAMGNKFNAANVGIPFRARLDQHDYVDSCVQAWMAVGHDDRGGGDRKTRPWPKDFFPTASDRYLEDPNWKITKMGG